MNAPKLMIAGMLGTVLAAFPVQASELARRLPQLPTKLPQKLKIQRGARGHGLVVSWTGNGRLEKLFPVRYGEGRKLAASLSALKSPFAFTPAESSGFYRLRSAQGVVSVNAVGYVNQLLPPGLTLLANPLRNTNDALTTVLGIGGLPDGAQVFKWVSDQGYEVSTYDAMDAAWSNPHMILAPGSGFFLLNPGSVTVTLTFVGEVLQGELVNTLPAGYSMEGSLVPINGSVNTVHGIPGEDGDALFKYVNDSFGGHYETSTFSATSGAWEPDLIVGVAEGFWTQKRNRQDWVWNFTVN